MFATDDPSLPRLSLEARRKQLTVEFRGENCFIVDSFSNRGWKHSVQRIGDLMRCGCQATIRCSHGALALYESDMDFYRLCRDWETDQFWDFRVRARLGKLKPSERKRVEQAEREVYERFGFYSVMPETPLPKVAPF